MLKNSWWLFFDKIIRQGLNFLLTVYIARYLGAAEFGEWNYAIALVALFSFFSTFGLFNILLRDFVRYPEKAGEFIGSAFCLRFFGGCLTLLFSSGCAYIFKSDAAALQVLILITAVNYIAQSFDVIDFYFQASLKSSWIATARGLSFVLFGGVKLALVHYNYEVTYFAAAQAAEFLVSGILMAIFLKRALLLSSIRVSRSVVLHLVRDSWPILFAEIAIIIYMRTDQVIIGEMMGDYSLGNYSAAVKISEIWYFIPAVICSTFFPSIIQAHLTGMDGYRLKLQQLYDLLSGISVSIALLVSLSSFWIIRILFGADFVEASQALTIHVWAGVFVFWGFASNQQLVLEGLARISMYRTIIGMVVNVIFNFILIPPMGITGSAVATLLAQACSAWISSLLFRESRPIFWMNLKSLNPLRFITVVNIFLRRGLS